MPKLTLPTPTRVRTNTSLADIVAVAAGFIDGLEWGDNAKGEYSTVSSRAALYLGER